MPGHRIGNSVQDPRLPGYWSDRYLYQGSMEAADLAFGADGTGWQYWSNFGGAFELLLFRWRLGPESVLGLHLFEYAGGDWARDRAQGRRTYQLRERHGGDDRIDVAYEIKAGRDVNGRPVTLLEFERDVRSGLMGGRFARQRDLAPDERNPADGLDPAGIRPTALLTRARARLSLLAFS
jgi:hypothetical protein